MRTNDLFRWSRLLCCGLVLSACSGLAGGPASDEPAPDPPAPRSDAPQPQPTTQGRPARRGGAFRPTANHDAPSGPNRAGGISNNVTYGGGAVLSNVKVIPVFWTSGVASVVQEEIHCFFTAAVSSSYIDWLSEYDTPTQNIGRGTVLADVTITPTHTGSNLTDDNVRSELATQIDNHVLPAPDANTLYMIYFPPGISMSDNNGFPSCVGDNHFCAYHDDFSHDGQQVRYGIFPDYAAGGLAAAAPRWARSAPRRSLPRTR